MFNVGSGRDKNIHDCSEWAFDVIFVFDNDEDINGDWKLMLIILKEIFR